MERKSFMLFLLLEFIGFILLINNNLYLRYKQNDLFTEISGHYNDNIHSVKKYFDLEQINRKLLLENSRLKNSIIDSIKLNYDYSGWKDYEVTPVYIISNQYQFTNNYLILNKGSQDGIQPNMGVIGTQGIIGTTLKISPHYSLVLSILNNKTSISVKTKQTNHYGFLKWNEKNPHKMEVTDIPFEAKVKLNDTIVTSGNSTIFPKNIPVGIITKIERLKGNKIYKIIIKPVEDLTDLEVAYVVRNKYQNELLKLKDSIDEN